MYQQSVGQNGCLNCDAGKYSTATGATSDATCQNCNAGKYSTATGATSDATCQNCAAGRFQGSTGQLSCSTCALGHVSTAGASSCTACPVGTFTRKITTNPNPSADLTQCFDCAIGYYNDEQGKHFDQVAAPALGIPSGDWCKMCSNGRYQPQTGQSSCKNCAVGKYYYDPLGIHSNVAANCDSCAQGKYQNEEGKSSCKACPAQSWIYTTGASSCETCADQGLTGSQISWGGASGTGLTAGKCCFPTLWGGQLCLNYPA